MQADNAGTSVGWGVYSDHWLGKAYGRNVAMTSMGIKKDARQEYRIHLVGGEDGGDGHYEVPLRLRDGWEAGQE